MASWRDEPERQSGSWLCFRQTSPEWPPLYHNAGVSAPDQESGRWHRQGENYAQYLSLGPRGAWAECARYFAIRSTKQAREIQRNLWLVYVEETEIADLSSFDAYDACGLDPRVAVGAHEASQDLGDELREAGYRGVLSPSASLPGVVNLTLFGERYEHVLFSDLVDWVNPDPDSYLAVQVIAEAAPMPIALCTDTVFRTKKHEGYRAWLAARGRPLPHGAP